MERKLHLDSYEYIYHRYVFEKLLNGLARNECLVLDAGCGIGYSLFCQHDNLKIVGIDISRANIVECRRLRKNREYVVADLAMLPFIEGAFEGVLSVEVLEHVTDKTAVVNGLSRITEKGGFFLGCSTNILNPILFLDAKLPMLMKPLVRKLAKPGHYERHSRFNPYSLDKTLKSTGYRMDRLYLLGQPEFSETQTPYVVALLWILFDKLTKKKPLLYFKEVLMWQATRV